MFRFVGRAGFDVKTNVNLAFRLFFQQSYCCDDAASNFIICGGLVWGVSIAFYM